MLERGFSKMKIIKTKLRNSLSDNTLSALMNIAIKGCDLEQFNFEKATKVVQKEASKNFFESWGRRGS
jgi:hypothetical protein